MFTTKEFTPLFNTKDFSSAIGLNGAVGRNNHLRILETIIFPKSQIYVENIKNGIAAVRSNHYPYADVLYTNEHFIQKGIEENRAVPKKEEMLYLLRNFPKLPYLLGGNTIDPIYLNGNLTGNPFVDRHKRLYGIDCSGLLYFVTNGLTPRNTGELKKMGKEVTSLEPLDLIWFEGHMIIYLGDNKVIESREIDGIIYSDFSKRLQTIPKKYHFIRLDL